MHMKTTISLIEEEFHITQINEYGDENYIVLTMQAILDIVILAQAKKQDDAQRNRDNGSTR